MSTHQPAISLPFVFVDYAYSPEDALAQDIVALDKPNPCDLSQTLIWCGSRAQVHTIKLNLMRAANRAHIAQVILPSIMTLEDWVWQQEAPIGNVLSESNKQLILVDALRNSANLFQTNNVWPLAKELVNLFNECAQAQIPLHEGEQALQEKLTNSYRYPNVNTSNISRESDIVYRLWLAYRDQIDARGAVDPVEYYCKRINNHSHTNNLNYTDYYVVGKSRIYPAEALFLNRLSNSNNVSIYTSRLLQQHHVTHHHPHLRYIQATQHSEHSTNLREQVLDIVYTRSEHTYSRIQNLTTTCSSNIFKDWMSLYTCNSIETHVNAICLQAKKWLLAKVSCIGIVISDRMLARRIRAVLEEQGIQPSDMGGWTLSTTSAATIIEVLLDAIENNFKKDALLDLLSSPFLSNNHLPDSPYAQQTFQFKKYLKQHRNTTVDSIDTMIVLAEQCFESQETHCINMLNAIKSACLPLDVCKQSGEYPLFQLSDHLINALKQLGIYNELQTDIAGQQLIETLDLHIQSTRSNSIKINWKEWRQWLSDLLEHNYFIPPQTDKRITLCGFEHTDNMKFDAVIIAGVEENRLSKSRHRTFFNEKVCYELGLPTSHEENAINFVRFRQLIQQSNKVLLSAEMEMNGEPQEICAWVKLINLFSEQAYSTDIINTELDEIINAYNIYQQSKHDFSQLKTLPAQTNSPAELIPTSISATQYQSLVDCPYQYFAKYMLGLHDQQTADDFEASDYGMLVHQCLYEFHFNTEYNIAKQFNEKNLTHLIDHLCELSTTIFMQAAFPTTVKQGWLQRWLNNVPAYMQWMVERAIHWHPMRGESLLQTHINEKFTLYGQIDRIDTDSQQLAVIDYKTGSTKATKKSILNGELVQLPFYALLDDNITQAEYLSLGLQNEVRSNTPLNEQEISHLKSLHKTRIVNLINALLNEAKLFALGDDTTCRVCDYQGLCRKQHWN